MGADHDIPDLQVYGKGSADFKLPCGYVDENGTVFNHIYLREMTGVEDDILDDDDLNVSERITKVLANCTEKLTSESQAQPNVVEDSEIIKAAISDTLEAGLPFSIPDRMAAMLFLRRASVGDVYKFERKCPACGKVNKNKQINLADLEVNFCKDPTKRRVKVRLPRSGKEAVLRVLSASGERRIAEMRPTMKDVKSCAILARLETLDGKKLPSSNARALNVVKELPFQDRRRLISTFNVMEGSIETNIDVRCTSAICNEDFTFDLDIGQVFFSTMGQEVTADDLEWV